MTLGSFGLTMDPYDIKVAMNGSCFKQQSEPYDCVIFLVLPAT